MNVVVLGYGSDARGVGNTGRSSGCMGSGGESGICRVRGRRDVVGPSALVGGKVEVPGPFPPVWVISLIAAAHGDAFRNEVALSGTIWVRARFIIVYAGTFRGARRRRVWATLPFRRFFVWFRARGKYM